MTKVDIFCHCGERLEISMFDESSVSPEDCPSCGCMYGVDGKKNRVRLRIGRISDCELPTDHDAKYIQETYYDDLLVNGEVANIKENYEQAAILFQKCNPIPKGS